MSAFPTEDEIQEQLLRGCPVLDEILSTGMTLSASGAKIPSAGFSTMRNLVVLRRLMDASRPAKTLEVGLAHGGSALTIASAHRDFGHAAHAQHTAIDPFQRGYLQGAGLAALERAGLSGHVRHLEEVSQLALPGLLRAGEKFDLIYIDGSHGFDDVFVDFYFCDRLLQVNGHLVFDDCADPRVRKVTRFMERNYAGAYSEVPLERLFVPRNPTRLKLARIVGRNQVLVFQRTTDHVRGWESPLRSF